jgi:nitrate reductase beta subunit
MRDVNLGRETQPHIAESVGMTEEQIYQMYRLLAIAKYEDRYVIPTAYGAQAHDLEHLGCSLSSDGGPGMYESDPLSTSTSDPLVVSADNFHLKKKGAGGDERGTARTRVNLLDWDGGQLPAGMFPEERKR